MSPEDGITKSKRSICGESYPGVYKFGGVTTTDSFLILRDAKATVIISSTGWQAKPCFARKPDLIVGWMQCLALTGVRAMSAA